MHEHHVHHVHHMIIAVAIAVGAAVAAGAIAHHSSPPSTPSGLRLEARPITTVQR
jgi:hypothetical protein